MNAGRFTSNPVIDQPINGTTSGNINIKSMEKRKTDTFLDKVYKKSISNKIRQKNRKKKLMRESAIQDSSFIIKDKKSQSYKKKEAENVVQDMFDFTATSASEKIHMTEISMMACHEKSDTNNSSNILQNLACLI